MQYCGAEISYNFNTLYIEELTLDSILFADSSSTSLFWYVLFQDGRLAGCIGSREYAQICEAQQIVIKKDCLYIYTEEREKQVAGEIFTTTTKIKRIPVLDKDGKLLYEYVRSVEAYYEDLDIQFGINKGSSQKNIIVSLTSYGKRLDMVHLTIKSIMNQTLKADKIILYISEEDSKRHINKEEELIKAGLTIIRNVRDLKPHKKYFYSMQDFLQSIIITIDDDAMYDDRLIEKLYTYHLKYPNAIICSRGHRMTKENGKVSTYNSWEMCVQSNVPERGICATGVGGILYPSGEYRRSFIDEEGIFETSLYGDDLWLKAVELLEGVCCFAIGWDCYKTIMGSQEMALGIENVYNMRNDEYLVKLQDYFMINFGDLF